MKSKYFWGLFFILIGIVAFLNSFNINIPVFRILIAFLLIYTGFSLISGKKNLNFLHTDANTSIFSINKKYTSDNIFNENNFTSNELNIIFSNSLIDLRNINLKENKLLEIDNVFSSTEVLMPSNIPLIIECSSAFGSVTLPNGSEINFGDEEYSSLINADNKYLKIKAECIFGSMKFYNK